MSVQWRHVSTVHLAQLVGTEALLGFQGCLASGELPADGLNSVCGSKGTCHCRPAGQAEKDTHASTHGPQGDRLPLQAGSIVCKAGCLTLAQRPCFGHFAGCMSRLH